MNPLMNQPCRIDLLGRLRAQHGERSITRFQTYKTGALLAYLAYYQPQPQPREVLIEMFWPDGRPERGSNNLSIALSSLRHQLEPPGVPMGSVLLADRLTVGLNPAGVTTDVMELRNGLQQAAQSGTDANRTQTLLGAVALYQGELLPGFYDDWILPERQRLAESYLQALRQLVRLLAKRHDFSAALDYALQAVKTDPLREEAHRDLMRLYVAAGQPSVALKQYAELEQILQHALGQKPSATTRQLRVQIETHQQAPAEPGFASPHALKPTVSHLQEAAIPSLPTGTVTFLFTDIVGSTVQWERAGEAFQQVLTDHHALLRQEFASYRGYVFKETGDGFLVAFQTAGDALTCAIAGQNTLNAHTWPVEVGPLRVRMGLHTGDASVQEGDYHSLTLHRASRILTAAHGGQILCSEATAGLLRRDLAADRRLTDLGSYRLRDLPASERLFQIDYPGRVPTEFPAPNAEAGYTSTLPLSFTRFFGRALELARLQEMLLSPQTRLVTLSGAGGTGKTRLALEVARALLGSFSGAAWFVSLSEVSEASLIPQAVVAGMHLQPSPSGNDWEHVIESLARQPSLLILDNFEQLVETGAPSVQTLLSSVASLTCLITSRQTLRLSGEQEFALAPLPVPGGTDTPERLCLFESVQLFIDRAQAARPDFQVTGNNAAAIATLCDRLEGIPLAIELAAARAQVLTPAQMLAQLQNRFEFLVSRKRDATERHRTLRTAIDWSYTLLTPDIQDFFACLSVFRGGWTLVAAEAVCEQPLALDFLAQLRECSLVLVEEEQEGAGMRFRMLETLREFALAQLAPEQRQHIQQRHLNYFLNSVEEANSQWAGPESGIWLERLGRENDNLRAALVSCEENQAEAGSRLGVAMIGFWYRRGYWEEGRRFLAAILSGPQTQEWTQLRARALLGAGVLNQLLGDYAAARSLLEESLAISRKRGEKEGIADAIGILGNLARHQADYAAARSLYEEQLTLSRERGDRQGIAASISNLGTVAYNQGNDDLAHSLYEESLSLCRELKDKAAIAIALSSLGNIAQHRRHYVSAWSLYEESLTLSKEAGDKRGIANVLNFQGATAQAQGEWAVARSLYGESLNLFRELQDRRNIARMLISHAHLAVDQDQAKCAAVLYGAADALCDRLSVRFGVPEWKIRERDMERLPKRMGEQAFAAARVEGQAMTVQEAVAYALVPEEVLPEQ